MKTRNIEAFKLGVFILSGIVLLILSLYILGKNKDLLGTRFELKTRFKDVNGLLVGNKVRFSGIEAGNVRRIQILNDTVVEVTMKIDKEYKNFIRTNSIAQIGTDGLIGNRLVDILPQRGEATFVQGGELLGSIEEVNNQEILRTLYHTNENIALISEELLTTVRMINSSTQLSRLLNDSTLVDQLSFSLRNLSETTKTASLFAKNAVQTLKLASEGSGTLATLLTDTIMADELRRAVKDINGLESKASQLLSNLTKSVETIGEELHSGKGVANTVLYDSSLTLKLKSTIENVERGTASFAENMEALKSNYLFRRYFKKKEKEEN
ncbi:MAG: MCE family protein [Saprospiraceae bacterium]|nr:MCE family protein [Saprospiraceae bacterium]